MISILLTCLLAGSSVDGGSAEKIPECGVAAIYGICALQGIEASPQSIESLILQRTPGANLSALSLRQIVEALGDLGIAAKSYQVGSSSDFHTIATPCILYFRPDRVNASDGNIGHVVIATSIGPDVIRILDLSRAREPFEIPMSALRNGWDGEYIAVSREKSWLGGNRLGLVLVTAVGFIVFVWSVRSRATARTAKSGLDG